MVTYFILTAYSGRFINSWFHSNDLNKYIGGNLNSKGKKKRRTRVKNFYITHIFNYRKRYYG